MTAAFKKDASGRWRLYLPAVFAVLFVLSVFGMLVGDILMSVRLYDATQELQQCRNSHK